MSGDFDILVRNVNINFGSNTKLAFEIDSGLDRKTNAGNDTPRITRLEIVDVDTIAVSFFANGMAGTMRKLFPKTCAGNYATRDIVHFGAADRFTGANILAHEINRRIAGFAHNIENA